MQLRAGIPLISEVDALVKDELFRQHTEYNRNFLQRHGPAMKGYGSHWGEDPLRLWSRRWEYPFVGQRLIDFGKAQHAPIRILDAGSGVTYFDYMVCDALPGSSVICADSDPSYNRMFASINANTPDSRVSFVEAMLQSLPMESHSVDAICCISVLEHTNRYDDILDEFSRVLRPDGLLVLTFDLSLDGRFELSKGDAAALLKSIQRHFAPLGGIDLATELERMDQKAQILSTDHVKCTQPELLPWKYPLLKGLHDLIKGKGWTGGFRSKSVFCLEAVKK